MAKPIYPGAPETLIQAWNKRRGRLQMHPHEALPPANIDLKPLSQTKILLPDELAPNASGHARKDHQIRRELYESMPNQASELAALNGLLISHLRKRRPAPGAQALFLRIWHEESEALLAELSPRWLISSAITFGRHGDTEAQRHLGLAINVMFSLMKLYEFERICSGQAADQPFKLKRGADRSLPLDMPLYSLVNGDLDINLLAEIWEMAEDVPGVGPIALKLLDLINHEQRGLFRRMTHLRTEALAQREARAARDRARQT